MDPKESKVWKKITIQIVQITDPSHFPSSCDALRFPTIAAGSGSLYKVYDPRGRDSETLDMMKLLRCPKINRHRNAQDHLNAGSISESKSSSLVNICRQIWKSQHLTSRIFSSKSHKSTGEVAWVCGWSQRRALGNGAPNALEIWWRFVKPSLLTLAHFHCWLSEWMQTPTWAWIGRLLDLTIYSYSCNLNEFSERAMKKPSSLEKSLHTQDGSPSKYQPAKSYCFWRLRQALPGVKHNQIPPSSCEWQAEHRS